MEISEIFQEGKLHLILSLGSRATLAFMLSTINLTYFLLNVSKHNIHVKINHVRVLEFDLTYFYKSVL